jgi:hypothetical protein
MMDKAVGFDENVFINCPFDKEYAPLFRSIVFAIHDAGFRPRCALEAINAGELRLNRIVKIISECRYSIHDISRTELDRTYSLPRFNMPVELGIGIGCTNFGEGYFREKLLLIMDRRPFTYQKFVSDPAGLDIASHSNKPKEAIWQIRKWLRTGSGRTNIPGGQIIYQRYRKFQRDLPRICLSLRLDFHDLTFVDFSYLIAR